VAKNKFVLLTPEGRGIFGEMDENGIVTFVVEAGPESSIRGTELFNRMMLHFGDDVRAIHGVCCKGPLGRPSTNIDKVNELTAGGMTLEAAIHHAWTVTRAKKLGYSRVRVIGTPAGVPGAFTKIDVLIEK
jgi:hypothetical protein